MNDSRSVSGPMNELPNPPVPAAADLKDFAFTPIYRARLFGSAFHARTTDAEWRAGVTLWLKCQDQTPAGSLPDDDIELCRLAELGRDLKTWRKIRPGALHGWYRCNDGRLYNDVVAEVVNEQWMGKLRQRWNAECARLRKAAQRAATTPTLPSFEEWLTSNGHAQDVSRDNDAVSHGTNQQCPVGQGTDVPWENSSKREREGQRQRQRQGERQRDPRSRIQGSDDPLSADEPPTLAFDAKQPDDAEQAFAAYNAMAARCDLPKAAKFGPDRRAKLRQRLKDCGGLSGWIAALSKLEASSMCRGRNDRGWVADLDFLLQAQSFTRLMEGRYDDRKPQPGANRRYDPAAARVATLAAFPELVGGE